MKSQVEAELSLIVQKAQHVSATCADLVESITKLEASLGQDSLCEPAALPDPSVPPAPDPPKYAEIRGLLAELATNGKCAEVKDLIQSYGCSKLQQVDVRFHQDLWEKARALL